MPGVGTKAALTESKGTGMNMGQRWMAVKDGVRAAQRQMKQGLIEKLDTRTVLVRCQVTFV